MTENASPEKPASCCAHKGKGFNFCFWAKLIVGIPAIPIIGLFAAMLFTHPLAQIAAGVMAMVVALAAAIAIDRAPMFSGMVIKK